MTRRDRIAAETPAAETPAAETRAAEGGPRLYFAYGSNVSEAGWAEWCRHHGFPADLIEPRCRAWLPDHEPRVHYRSSSRRGGALDVVPLRGSFAPGFLFALRPGALRALDRKEGAPSCYERVVVDVIAEPGGGPPRLVRALTYRVRPERVGGFVFPTRFYVDEVLDGFRARGIDDHLSLITVDAALAGDPPGPWPYVAVYGTLREGGGNHGLLSGRGARFVGTGRLPGRLLDLGHFPMLRLHAPGEGAVVEVWALRDPEADLARLDALEGFDGYGRPYRFYARMFVPVALDDGETVRAWTWTLPERFAGPEPDAALVETLPGYAGDEQPAVPGGDWMALRR